MLFEQWSLLMDELKIEILSKLIYSSGFPQTLLQVTPVSVQSRAFAKDFSIWQAALRYYFPLLEKINPETGLTPIERFKKIYVACEKVMAEKNVNMSDFIMIVQNDWKNIPDEKKDILIGLGLVAGFEDKIDKSAITIQAKSYALLFATCFDIKSQIYSLITLNAPAIAAEFVRLGLNYAAEFGHLTIFAYYLSKANARLDHNTKRSALIKAATHGHFDIINLIVKIPGYWQGAVFALRKAILMASENGHAKVVEQLLTKLTLNTESATLREALKLACQKNHPAVVDVLLQQASPQMNALTVIALLKKAVFNGDVEIVSLFFQHTNQYISDTMVLEMLRQAMIQKHENVIMLILEKRHAKLSTYVKRQLFVDASHNGFASVVGFLLRNDPIAIDKTFKRQALKAAEEKHHTQVIELLQVKKDKNEVTDKDVEGLSTQIEDLYLGNNKKNNIKPFTPKYHSMQKSTSVVVMDTCATTLKKATEMRF
jgi:CheY-like chemotaxis protein